MMVWRCNINVAGLDLVAVPGKADRKSVGAVQQRWQEAGVGADMHHDED
jgi:hypothetical protein